MLPPTEPVIPEEDDYNELVPPSTSVVPPAELPPPEGSYNPISALVISLVSFLVAFLILFLLYFHFYQVGKKIRDWLKNKSEKGEQKVNNMQNYPPMVPPRSKKGPAPQPTHQMMYTSQNMV